MKKKYLEYLEKKGYIYRSLGNNQFEKKRKQNTIRFYFNRT